MIGWLGVVAALVLAAWQLARACHRANRTDWGNAGLNLLDGFNRIFCRRFHRLRARGLRLPARGGAIVVANHVSGLDPLLLIAAARRPLRFMIAREEYERWWLKPLFRAVGCIPVERGRNPRATLHEARRALERGEVVALFPHGRITLDPASTPLKRGVLVLSRTAGCPIVPVRIEGVRGQGLTVPAVFLRSRARLRMFPALPAAVAEGDEVLDRLATQLSGKT